MKFFSFAILLCFAYNLQGARPFVANAPSMRSSVDSSTSLGIGPLQKATNRKEYNKVVDGLMLTRGITREEAEKEYDTFLNNPNDYALNKGEAYYKSLGYKTLMEGVIGEAEKEGRGDEVRARIEKFNRESKTKGLVTIGAFITLFFYLKINYPYVPPL
mmetsp:Transcript_197/g.502  ORF Transcript_197/g.502 Transcript_197/m.502 type:complete len:159 (-) Transcript_197:2241-2717(-)